MRRRRFISFSCQTGNCSVHESPEQVYDFLSVNKHTHTCIQIHSNTHTHNPTQVGRHHSSPMVMSFHLSFISILQFHHSLIPPPPPPISLLFLFQPYCFSSSLHRSLVLFLIQAHCFSFCLFLSRINPLARTPSLSPRLAVFIFQSFISTNVRQCYCPPSIDPQREKEMGREREAGGKWGKAVTGNKVEREVQGEEWEI